MSDTSNLKPELLLQNLGWLRGLAHSLVSDVDGAEDLVQETLVTALQSPPRQPGALRGWLRTVARSLFHQSHRRQSRRQQREQTASRSDRVDADVEGSLERAELQRLMVDAMLRLDEPYRTTLVLRFFEELTPAQIATKLDVPVGTVRVRSSRALEKLRQSIDDSYDGDHRACSVALLALATPHRMTSMTSTAATTAASSLFLGGVVMGKQVLIAATALVMLLGGAALWWGKDAAPPESGDSVAGRSRGIAKAPSGPGSDPTVTGQSDRSSSSSSTDSIDGSSSPRILCQVVDSEGNPLAGVRVRAAGEGDRAFATTSLDGRASFSEWPPLPLVLELADKTYLMSGDGVAVIHDGQLGQTHRLEGVRGGEVTGRVLDRETGNPVAAVHVVANPPEDTDPESNTDHVEAKHVAETTADGRFVITGLPAGRFSLSATRTSEYGAGKQDSVQVSVELQSAIGGVTLYLDPGIRVRGRVVDTENNGVPGASVHCSTGTRADRFACSSDSSGSFEFSLPSSAALQPMFLSARVDSESGVLASEGVGPIDLKPGSTAVTLMVAATGSIAGRVIDQHGAAVANYQQIAIVPVEGDGARYYGSSDADGRFLIDGIVPGSYWVSEEQCDVGAGAHHEGIDYVTLRQSLPAQLVGRISDPAGRPLVDAHIAVVWGNEQRQCRSDDRGDFRLEQLPEEEVILLCSMRGYAQHQQRVTPRPSSESNPMAITLGEHAHVEGTVVNALDSAPIQQFALFARRGQHSSSGLMSLGLLQQVFDPQGEFRVDAVEGPIVTLFVAAPGFIMSSLVVRDVFPGVTLDDVRVELTPVGEARGRVVDDSGGGVPNAAIYLRPPRGNRASDRSAVARTDPSGYFEIMQLLDPQGTLWGVCDGYAVGKGEYTLASLQRGMFQIVLTPRSEVRGRVTLGDRPLQGATISVMERGRQQARAITRADGRFVAELDPGRYTLLVESGSDAGNSRTQRDIEVNAGKPTVVDFEFAAGTATLLGRVHRGNETPAEPATVSLVRRGDDTDAVEATPTHTDSEGRYVLKDCTAGNFALIVSAVFSDGKRVTKALEVALDPGGVTQLDIDFKSGQNIAVELQQLPIGQQAILLLFEGDIDLPQLSQEGVMKYAQKIRGQTQTSSNAAKLQSVAAGAYSLLIVWGEPSALQQMGSGLQFRVIAVEVIPNESARVEVDLGASD